MQRRSLVLLLAAMPAGLSLSGCATFEAAPQHVLTQSAAAEMIARHPIDESIEKFSYPDSDYYNWTYRKGLTQQQYRNMVVEAYMKVMDLRYEEFTTALSSERRQADFGLDLAVLAFTGWASVAKASIVNNLSAVAAGFAGTRGLVDKDLYFDKAMPALIAAMDADRFRARAEIETKLKLSAGDYPLETAFGDLLGYEVASTLNGAVTRITEEATQDRKQARQELISATTACHAEEGAAEVSQHIFHYLRGLLGTGAAPGNDDANLIKLFKAARALDLSGAWTTRKDVFKAIQDKVSEGVAGACSKATLEDYRQRISAATGEAIP
ncbi:MAG: hypothetical protein QOH86_2016 [Sphingomonadales bacterium]|jgi:hypothetical protein|nr:hypothetical protein [Sphingomonadales bacterium]